MTEVLSLSAETKLKLLGVMLESRHSCLREESLNHQGNGHFHISGQGHEAPACAGMLMESDDYACPYVGGDRRGNTRSRFAYANSPPSFRSRSGDIAGNYTAAYAGVM